MPAGIKVKVDDSISGELPDNEVSVLHGGTGEEFMNVRVGDGGTTLTLGESGKGNITTLWDAQSSTRIIAKGSKLEVMDQSNTHVIASFSPGEVNFSDLANLQKTIRNLTDGLNLSLEVSERLEAEFNLQVQALLKLIVAMLCEQEEGVRVRLCKELFADEELQAPVSQLGNAMYRMLASAGPRLTTQPLPPALSTAVIHLGPLQLPAIDTDEGICARVFIAESRTPAYASYDEDQTKLGMQAMKTVIYNRLNNNPTQFGAPGATSYADIVTAPGQFFGFSEDAGGNVQISDVISVKIDRVLKLANTGSPGAYYRFVSNCLKVANDPVNDPFPHSAVVGGVNVNLTPFGWRTEGASSPGGSFFPIPATFGGIIAGNQFFALH